MNKIRLGVNIDHVATVRNVRGELYPSPLRAALIAQKNKADSVFRLVLKKTPTSPALSNKRDARINDRT